MDGCCIQAHKEIALSVEGGIVLKNERMPKPDFCFEMFTHCYFVICELNLYVGLIWLPVSVKTHKRLSLTLMDLLSFSYKVVVTGNRNKTSSSD